MPLAADLSLALDAAALARKAGLEPDPWQERALRSPGPRMLLNCSRQSGKSTVAALLGVHTAIYERGALVLIVAPSLRQSQELFRRCLDLYTALGRPEPPEAESALRLELEGGSRIVSLPGREGTIRGYSGVRLLILDEASRVEDGLYNATRPMLAVSGGRLVALSTPFGTRGWWYEAWRGPELWERYEVPAAECPRISPAFLEEERRTIGAWWYGQEYECQFLDAQSAAFRSQDVEAAFSDEVETWEFEEDIAEAEREAASAPRVWPALHVGADIGQRVDPTAIVVAEAGERVTDRLTRIWLPSPLGRGEWCHAFERDTVYTVRALQRLDLGTSYPDVAARIAAVVTALVARRAAELEQAERSDPNEPGRSPASRRREALDAVRVWLDATGVGQPVVDLVRQALRDTPVAVCAAVFTYGDTYTGGAGRPEARVGKAHLVSRLQALFQTQCIKLPRDHPEARQMQRELQDYEIRVDQDANDKYGAFKVGTHDDLVTALGLACLEDPRSYRISYLPPVYE